MSSPFGSMMPWTGVMPEAGIRLVGPAFRAHSPKWSYLPLSGDGAKKRGGRFNFKGVPALYLSGDEMTAIREATRGRRPMQPLTLVEYHLDCEDILDARRIEDPETLAVFSEAGLSQKDIVPGQLGGREWRRVAKRMTPGHAGAAPASWQLSDVAKRLGYKGMIFPSFLDVSSANAWNVVLWTWAFEGPQKIVPFDPEADLPKDASSWNPMDQRLP